MTEKKKKELERALAHYAMTEDFEADDTPQKILQEMVNDISKNVMPLRKSLIPFYIAALECIAKSMRAHFPDEADIANDLREAVCCYGIVFPYSNNK